MDELMENKLAVVPTIRPDKNPIPEGESSGVRIDELGSIGGGAKIMTVWSGNAGDLQQPDFLRMSNADFYGVGNLNR
jgi:hypothetical protein